MSYVKVWIHCVWGTKRRTPFLTKDNKWDILNHIKENARKKEIYVDFINGYKDHIHCLISLKPDQSISKVIQLIKGESSFWINKNKICKSAFQWADDYFAASVSESQLTKVREYIKSQDEHHRNKTWGEEYDEFMKEFNFIKVVG